VADQKVAPTDQPQLVTNHKTTGHLFLSALHKLGPGESAFIEGELARLLKKKAIKGITVE
jgi:hypothetical protein